MCYMMVRRGISCLTVIGEITVDRSSPIMTGWVLETPPTAEISEAYLKIEGVIPEPATILLFGLGALSRALILTK